MEIYYQGIVAANCFAVFAILFRETSDSVTYSLDENQFSNSENQVIQHFIKHIVPVVGLELQAYAEVSNGLFANSETDQGLANNMRAFIEALNAQVAYWMNADTDAKIAAINQVNFRSNALKR